nr:hypothetical protein [uncultured Sediminibacterium sp.]
MNDQIKVLNLLQVVGHPRDSKRITGLLESGFSVSAMSFEREYHSGRLPDCPLEILDKIENGKYMARFFKIIKALPKLRKKMRHANVVYASGQDMAAMAYLAGLGLSKPIIMEVGDIVDLQLSNSLFSKIVRKVEKFLVNRYKLLVVISPGFLEDYYHKWLKVRTPGMVLENKLELSFSEKMKDRPLKNLNTKDIFQSRPLRIGYFGLLRDEWSWKVLEKLALEHPKEYEVFFAGMPINPKDIVQRIAQVDNMKYLGEYKSPDDLPDLYGEVDMVWACYPRIGENDWNLKWGRPNRFYESCFFGKPTFARKGAHFATDVERLQIGKAIDTHELSDVVAQVRTIKVDDLTLWQKNLETLSPAFYLYLNETEQLAERIKGLI